MAVGEYEVLPHFVIGPAIDEAADAHERAQGAIVWLMPSARARVAEWLHPQPTNTHLVRFDVPLKGVIYSIRISFRRSRRPGTMAMQMC